MSDESAFLAAIRANPADLPTKLVYADWLDERGDPRGRFLRLECELIQIQNRLEAIPGELARLQPKIDPTWLEAVGLFWGVVLRSYPPNMKIQTIKLLRELLGCGLKDAKDFSENLPMVLADGLTRRKAEEVAAQFRGTAEVELVPSVPRP